MESHCATIRDFENELTALRGSERVIRDETRGGSHTPSILTGRTSPHCVGGTGIRQRQGEKSSESETKLGLELRTEGEGD